VYFVFSDEPYSEAAGLPCRAQPAAVATTADPDSSPETTTAAGHKREVNPQGKVVTAAAT
jgi:hypothetical protein